MMRALNNIADVALSGICYSAPEMVVVEISVERGFEASNEAGFQGPTYSEEDVEW